jgi:transcriptional regulator with XRE-family HTH domain
VTSTASNIAQNIAITIKVRRKALGITQEELADLAGIDRTYASQLERAIANPSLTVLCKVANSLDLKLVDLIGDGGEKAKS